MTQPPLCRRAGASLLAFGALAAVAGCATPEKKPDSVRADTPVAEVAADPPPAPPPAQPKIGLMPILRSAPSDGVCTTAGVEATRLVLRGDTPLRTITVGVGAASRAFLPTYIEVISTQAAGPGQDENEKIYVGFTEAGTVENGRRLYFLTGSPPSETSGLLPDDGEAAKRLAQEVLDKCGKK